MRTVLSTGLCLLALAGCSSADDGDERADPSAAATLTLPSAPPGDASPAPPSAAATTNARGNVEQALGQQAGILGPDGGQALIFAVDDIVVDEACTGRDAAAPADGHYIGVHIRVTTGDLSSLGGTWGISPTDWAIIGPAGETTFDVVDEGTMACLAPPEAFPTEPLESGQQVTGTVVLRSPTPTGTVLFTTPELRGNGWEWTF